MFRAVILGAPASGKGTISSRIVNHFGLTHVASGDLLRNEILNGSTLGTEAKKFVDSGKLVPDDLILKLVLSELTKLNSQNWLLDGFPRTSSQAEILLKKYNINLAIALEVPVEEIVNRVKGRWVHIPSGRVYNETFNRPKVSGLDDVTGDKLEQRPDDAPDAVRRRLQLYEDKVQPLMTLYQERGILRRFAGRTSDEIWPQVRDVLSQYLKAKPKSS